MQNALQLTRPETIIAGVAIRQDADGRYSLNDLHAASGGAAKHKPSEWLRNGPTQELAQEISKAGKAALVSIRGGAAPGTWVAKEMVYAYAMWISPVFHLAVIRAYDTLMQAHTMAIPKNFAEALRLAADRQEELDAANSRITVMLPQVDALHRLADTTGVTLCQRDAAKHMQIKPGVFVDWLLDIRWTYRRTENNRLVGFQDVIDRGYLTHKMVERPSSDGATKQEPHVRVTPKGLARLAYYVARGRGPK